MNKPLLPALLSIVALSAIQAADTQTQSQPQVGQPAPDFTLPSAEGGSVSLITSDEVLNDLAVLKKS